MIIFLKLHIYLGSTDTNRDNDIAPLLLNSLFKLTRPVDLLQCNVDFIPFALQVAGDSCRSGQSLSGQRKLPWAVLLYREASEVLSDWSYSGGEISTKY